MYRTLYLALLCSGDCHPDVALYYVSVCVPLISWLYFRIIISLCGAFCLKLKLVEVFTISMFFVAQSNIGLILHAVGEFELSLRFLQRALELSTKYVLT
jgi:hypothetical protein